MNTLRNTLFAASLAAGALSGWSAAGEPPRPAPPREPPQAGQPARPEDLQRQLQEARARLEQATREVAELSRAMGRGFVYRFEGAQPRALLGVEISTSDRKDGAHVMRVSPGGAAEEAGIKAGDIITSIGGQDLGKEQDPGRVLVERMGQIEPDLKVQVGVLRDGRKMNFDVTPRPAPVVDGPVLMQRMFEGRARQQGVAPGGPAAGVAGLPPLEQRRLEIRAVGDGDGTLFRDVEFATLSEQLGSYFGVKSGVLVVRAGSNPAFKLQDGDVILAIDGRAPTSAQHAGRILRSYGEGEKLKLRVQRDRKAQDIEITMPGPAGERRGGGPAAQRR